MSDQNVKAAQKYLNAMFGGHKDWVKQDAPCKERTVSESSRCDIIGKQK